MDTPTEFLQSAASCSPGSQFNLSIREFVAKWGVKRRGYTIVQRIQSDLSAAGLTTEPLFTEGWIDNHISLIPIGEADQQTQRAKQEQEGARVDGGEVGLRISSFKSASNGIASVTPQATLEEVQSLMMKNDYSQLAVLAGERDLRGAVSWESIAQARLRSPAAGLTDALVRAELVAHDDEVLTAIPRIVDAGYVFVRNRERVIEGIVSTADLSEEFAALAKPFFLIGEIERRIRQALEYAFEEGELRAVRSDTKSSTRTVESASDLTLGECVHLLEKQSRWSKLGWGADRAIFIETFHEVREIRNDVMHFSPDPISDEDVQLLQNFIKWLQSLQGY